MILGALLIAARLALPDFVRWNVNRVLEQSSSFAGSIGDVELHLWRGAYSIREVRVSKVYGTVPVPLFEAERVDFAVRWDALLDGSVVARLQLVRPVLNFVDADDSGGDQTGAGGPWLSIVQDLFPFSIDEAEVVEGEVHFRAFETEPPVDVFLHEIDGRLENLTNLTGRSGPLFATVDLSGRVMQNGELDFQLRFDPSTYRPTFELALRALGIDVTELDGLARAYGNVDFESGFFDLVVQMKAEHGQVEGYLKPLFRNLQVFDPASDLGLDLVETFWEALVGLGGTAFENRFRDQLGTVIPLRGDLDDPNVDLLATIGNLLHNAFVRAFLPRFQGLPSVRPSLEFGPGELLQDFESR